AGHGVLPDEPDHALDAAPGADEDLVREAERPPGRIGHRVERGRVAVATEIVQRQPVAVRLLDVAQSIDFTLDGELTLEVVAHPGFREEIELAGVLWIANQRRVKTDLRPKRRAVEREDVAGPLTADDRETPAEVTHEAALVAVRPPHAHRAVVRRARTAVRAGEVERQPSAGDHH